MSEESLFVDQDNDQADEVNGLFYAPLVLYSKDRENDPECKTFDYEFWMIEGDLKQQDVQVHNGIPEKHLLTTLKNWDQKLAICITIYNERWE